MKVIRKIVPQFAAILCLTIGISAQDDVTRLNIEKVPAVILARSIDTSLIVPFLGDAEGPFLGLSTYHFQGGRRVFGTVNVLSSYCDTIVIQSPQGRSYDSCSGTADEDLCLLNIDSALVVVGNLFIDSMKLSRDGDHRQYPSEESEVKLVPLGLTFYIDWSFEERQYLWIIPWAPASDVFRMGSLYRVRVLSGN